MSHVALYPSITPYQIHQLAVGQGHRLYLEEAGNPNGIPVLVLHGGPGSGCNDNHRQRFNPKQYRIICFDQRVPAAAPQKGKPSITIPPT